MLSSPVQSAMKHVFLAASLERHETRFSCYISKIFRIVITDQFSSNSKPLNLKLRAEGTFNPVQRADERQLLNSREQTSTGFHREIAVTFALAYMGRPKTKEDPGKTHKAPAVK